ncbi:hypothetical protein F3087_40150 [Nocardia colli]|uniref:Histidine decarboxylase n=1 Tax=Nocardia colli TaxID=2545717 RepID=A0A5N0E198_9NOCA|nr:pyridoxal-dependent decarboxylase [Nocardia colli]KAA8881884.1 hypothetical protein F3087_40150 [Nocardia colli]
MDHRFSDDYAINEARRSEQELLDELEDFLADALPAGNEDRMTAPSFRLSDMSTLLNIPAAYLTGVGAGTGGGVTALMRRAIVDLAIRLTNGEYEDVHGYVTSGGAEANLFGLDRGCRLLPAATIYCSTAAPPSVRYSAQLMRKRLVVVPVDSAGQLNVNALARECWRDAGRGAVVVASAGTLDGAIDDVDAIIAAASGAGRVSVHVDATGAGLVVPFIADPESWGFAKKEVGSITIGMDRALGLPMSAAVALSRVEPVDHAALDPADRPVEFAGSGLPSLLLWYALASKGVAGLALSARKALGVAEYAAAKLGKAGLHPVRHRWSTTVIFDRPEEWICRKYHLSTGGGRARIATMPDVRKETIDELCRDIVRGHRSLGARLSVIQPRIRHRPGPD